MKKKAIRKPRPVGLYRIKGWLYPTSWQLKKLKQATAAYTRAREDVIAYIKRTGFDDRGNIYTGMYYKLRRDHDLPSAFAYSVIAQGLSDYENFIDPDKEPPRLLFNRDSHSWKGDDKISLLTLDGRVGIRFVCYSCQTYIKPTTTEWLEVEFTPILIHVVGARNRPMLTQNVRQVTMPKYRRPVLEVFGHEFKAQEREDDRSNDNREWEELNDGWPLCR